MQHKQFKRNPWRIHGTIVYLPTWMVDIYGKLSSPMDHIGKGLEDKYPFRNLQTNLLKNRSWISVSVIWVNEKKNTNLLSVDGWNPAPVEVGSLSQYL